MGKKSLDREKKLLRGRFVMTAKPGQHNDGGGLYLRVSEDDNASWIFRYSSPVGRRREMGLGKAQRSTLADAESSMAKARKAREEAEILLRQGLDPLAERDKNREAAKQAEQERKAEKAREKWTLARAARDFHERVIERSRTAKHAAQWIASLENHMPPALWHSPIEDITPRKLLQALEGAKNHERARREGDLGETLRRIRQRLDSVFEDAIFHERATTNPASAIRRKLAEARPMSAKGKFAALDYRQAPALMARLRTMPGTAARCLEFAVLTTSRTTEALMAQWSEIDLVNGRWTVPPGRMKAREEHVVYLSARAVEILRGQVGQDQALIFPSTQKGREGKPLSNMAMLAVLDRLNVRGETTTHGLCRATFSTWANETGAARPDVIEACLAHNEADKVRASYNRSSFSAERRALLAAWADYLARPAIALAA